MGVVVRIEPGLSSGRRVMALMSAAVVAVVLCLALGSASARADAPPPLATQIASDPVTVSAASFQRDLFIAGDVARLSDPANTEDLVLERVLQALYADNPGLDPTAAANEVTALRNAASVPSGATNLTEGANARIESVLVALQAAHPAGAIAPALAAVSQDAVSEVAADSPSGGTNPTSVVQAGESGDTLETNGSFAPSAVLSRSAALAATDHSFGQARDALWQTASHESIFASAADLLANTPSLATNSAVAAIAAMRDANGAINTTAGAIVGSATTPAANTVGGALADLQTQEAGAFSEASAVATGQETQAAAQQQSSTLLAAMNQDRTAATIGVVTLSGNKDATYASEAGTTAAAAGSIITALANYSAKNITAGIATGNVVGAALSLVPTILNLTGLTSSGPNPDELILHQLTALSNQIQSFQTEVNGRFDTVDQGLINVLDGVTNLSTQINQVAQQINQAQLSINQADSKITGVYDQVTRLQGSIDTLQANIYQALSNDDKGALQTEIDSVLGYQKANGTPVTLAQFNDAAAYFHNFATFTAAHSPVINGDQPSFDAQGVAAQLATGVSSNVDYLDQLPAQRGWRSGTLSGTSSSSPLPDPDAWALAARAYSQLLLENPAYVTARYRGWLADIEQEGAQLSAMVSTIGTGDTTNGTHSTLFNDLLCNYTSIANASPATWCPAATVSSASGVVPQLKQAEQQYLGAMTGYVGGVATTSYPLQQDNGQPLALWGAGRTTQTSDLSRLWTTLHPTVPECGPDEVGGVAQGLGPMQTPAHATPDDAAVPSWYQLADRLGLGTLTECWYADKNWGVSFNFVFTPNAPLQVPNWGSETGPIEIGTIWSGGFSGNCFINFPCGNTTPAQFQAIFASGQPVNTVDVPSSCSGFFCYKPLGPLFVSWGGYAPYLGSTSRKRMVATTCPAGVLPGDCYLYDFELDPAIQSLDAGALNQLQAGLLTGLLQGNQAAGNVGSGGVQQALQRLQGARGLLVDYASLGLSSTLQSDDTLAGLIRGSSALWGSSDVVGALQGALNAVQAGTPLTGDPATTIVAPGLIDNGATPLQTALAAAITAPAGGQAGSQASARVMTAAGPSSASPGSGPAAQGNPFIATINDRLALTTSSFGAGPAVTLSSPAGGATLTSATFTGTAADGPADSPAVTVNVYSTPDTSGQPVATASASESAGQWSVTVAGLANGTYTAQAQQSDTASPANVGHSSPVQFTLAAPASTPPSTGGGQPSSGTGGTPSNGGQSTGGGQAAGGVQAGGGGNSAPVVHTTVGRPTIRGNAVSVSVSCAGSAGAKCAVRLVLSLTERLQSGQIKGITASARAKRATVKTLTLGSATATIPAGHTQRVTVTLSAAGARMLSARHQLPATLVISTGSGHAVTVLSRQRLTFRATRPKQHR
jgi:hypothetical protein